MGNSRLLTLPGGTLKEVMKLFVPWTQEQNRDKLFLDSICLYYVSIILLLPFSMYVSRLRNKLWASILTDSPPNYVLSFFLFVFSPHAPFQVFQLTCWLTQPHHHLLRGRVELGNGDFSVSLKNWNSKIKFVF